MSEHESPVISVVVPFYDVEECVNDCMRSLLCQEFDRYEVVGVDDGSRDRTGELLDGYAATDPRVRVIRTDNRGLSEARNAGVRAARATLVSFVDGDDVVSPHVRHPLRYFLQPSRCKRIRNRHCKLWRYG